MDNINTDLAFRMGFVNDCVNLGFKMYSDDLCCQALAWLLIWGGGNSDVVYGKAVNLFLYAEKRANILGGETANPDFTNKIQEYYKTVVPDGKPYSKESRDLYYNPPQWVIDFETRYSIRRAKR